MLKERKKTEEYLNTISRFGYKNHTPTKTILPPFFEKDFHKNKSTPKNSNKELQTPTNKSFEQHCPMSKKKQKLNP